MKREKSCGAVIYRGENPRREYLILTSTQGHTTLCKGHMEGAETERETAVREIMEETGLTVDFTDGFREVVTYSPKPGVVKDVVFFLARPSGGVEHAQEEEIAALGWFTFREARPLVTFASDEDVLLAAEAYIKGTE